jgi:hypothetical protein
MISKEDFDEVKFHNDRFLENTESGFKDGIYNKIVNKYTSKRKKMSFSDRFVWKGSVYVLPEMIGYVLFFLFFYYLGTVILRNYGVERMFMFFILLVLWRLNIQIKFLKKLNDKLGGNI